jgi:hypothetical protein
MDRKPGEKEEGLACSRCQRKIPLGGSHYVMSLRLTAGFDGYLPTPPPGLNLSKAIDQCMKLSEEELEQSVDLLQSFTLCPPCRDSIAADPLQTLGNG